MLQVARAPSERLRRFKRQARAGPRRGNAAQSAASSLRFHSALEGRRWKGSGGPVSHFLHKASIYSDF